MKKPLSQKIMQCARMIAYGVAHPLFVKKYLNRYSKNFSQADLEYCVVHLYEFFMNQKLDLNNANTFNEKLNWLKCFYHNDLMTECVDKVTAPAHFMRTTGLDDSYIVKNLGIYDNPEEIKFDRLPDRFVLKSNWGSARQIIVQDKRNANLKKIKSAMASWCKTSTNHYYFGFEYGYKNIVPKIVCEEFVDFEYKIEFFCFDGKPLYFWTIFNDKTDDVCADFYDANTCKKMNLKHIYPNSSTEIKIPKEYKQMKDKASKLSLGFPFVRVDFFKLSESGFKFSEMTFYHWCGIMHFDPDEYDLEFGKHLELPPKMI